MSRKIKTVLEEVAPVILVPATAVIRGGQALFGQTGRKASLGGLMRVNIKNLSPKRNFGVFVNTIFLEYFWG